MNGVALLLAAASLAVDYSWEKSSAGQIEYMVRVEPEVIPSLVSGEEIHSDVPAEAGTIDRFRLRVGIDGNQPVFTPAAPGRFGVAPDRSAVVVRGGGAATETQDVTFGWQPGADGKLMYYVQIAPELLRTLEVGDEIQAAVDTSPGPAATFVVFGGNKQLPRTSTGGAGVAGVANASNSSPPSRFSPDGNTAPAGGQFGDSRYGGASPTAATEPGTSPRFGGAGAESSPSPNNSSPPSRFGNNGAANSTTTPPGQFPSNSKSNTTPPPYAGADTGGSRFGESRPDAFNPPPVGNSNAGAGNYSNGDSGRTPSSFNRPPAGGNDAFAGNNFGNPAGQEQPGRYGNRAPLEPPSSATSANRPLPPVNQAATQNPPAGAANQPPAAAPVNPNDRMAMVDPNTSRGAGYSAPPPAAPVAAAEEEKPWWWGWLVFFFCVMCLSIGGNLYLGWTAVEFYHRYQRAVERLRSGTTARV